MRSRLLLLSLLLIGTAGSLAYGQASPAATQPSAAAAATTRSAEDPAVPAMKTGRSQQAFLDRHQRYVERAKQGNVDVVFLGDSITQGWESRGKNVWADRYANRNAVNFGVSGDRTQHVLWRIANGELDGLNPKAVVLMIGTNNSGENSAADIVRGVTACVRAIQEKCPQAKIILTAIFPRGATPDDSKRVKLNEVNEQIKQLADGDRVRWLDFNAKLTEPDGTISKEMMPDYLHPTEKGYVIWADALDPVLAEIVK
jgi:beta-glucosidase